MTPGASAVLAIAVDGTDCAVFPERPRRDHENLAAPEADEPFPPTRGVARRRGRRSRGRLDCDAAGHAGEAGTNRGFGARSPQGAAPGGSAATPVVAGPGMLDMLGLAADVTHGGWRRGYSRRAIVSVSSSAQSSSSSTRWNASSPMTPRARSSKRTRRSAASAWRSAEMYEVYPARRRPRWRRRGWPRSRRGAGAPRTCGEAGASSPRRPRRSRRRARRAPSRPGRVAPRRRRRRRPPAPGRA